jgi:hypothetical protein
LPFPNELAAGRDPVAQVAAGTEVISHAVDSALRDGERPFRPPHDLPN